MTMRTTINILMRMSAVLTITGYVNLAVLDGSAFAQQPVTSSRSRYADGVYTATGQYGGSPSFITVRATLENGIITAVEVTPHATVPQSLELQRGFAAAVPKVVIGKPIDEVCVGKLAGSSGTPRGFNDAIRQIKQQAASSLPTITPCDSRSADH
jgi:uncharacterized protein with FMN-binding domain